MSLDAAHEYAKLELRAHESVWLTQHSWVSPPHEVPRSRPDKSSKASSNNPFVVVPDSTQVQSLQIQLETVKTRAFSAEKELAEALNLISYLKKELTHQSTRADLLDRRLIFTQQQLANKITDVRPENPIASTKMTVTESSSFSIAASVRSYQHEALRLQQQLLEEKDREIQFLKNLVGEFVKTENNDLLHAYRSGLISCSEIPIEAVLRSETSHQKSLVATSSQKHHLWETHGSIQRRCPSVEHVADPLPSTTEHYRLDQTPNPRANIVDVVSTPAAETEQIFQPHDKSRSTNKAVLARQSRQKADAARHLH